jgi:hypothetical protein
MVEYMVMPNLLTKFSELGFDFERASQSVEIKDSKNDLKKQRVFLVVSRQADIDYTFSTVICTPVYSKYDGFTTQFEVGIDEGLKHGRD